MGWFELELDPEVRPVGKGFLLGQFSSVEESGRRGEEGGDGRAPVRNRSERAV